MVANPYKMGSYVFTPTLTIEDSEKTGIYMTDDAGNSKHWAGTQLVTDASQGVKKYGTGSVSVTSDVAAKDGATIDQVYDEIGSKSGFKFCIVTIYASDARVKLRKDIPTNTSTGYADQSIANTSNDATKGIKFSVQVDSLSSTAVIASTNFYWLYDGTQATDGSDNADGTISEITLTATVTFAQTDPNT